ncbi:sushi, von Willebrand factor type A, EGF and pentraxin domain-containing protein 1-like [Rhopilema esculentum]|uniref:sushi, von Willebrand factor type A, EGF and pentraxin domain-containing protein 1-like n=1 Tax=Rhopilema esculentum TaxID=499914 RepID=UPI0031D36E3C
MNPVLLLLIFVGSLHIEFCTSLTCEDYKRPLKENSAVNSVSRKFLNCWGSEVEHGESDLIILIDKSGSMMQSGWNAAKDFVDALLTEVRVAFNATRITIGTFASTHRLELNYLTKDTGPASHKCRFARDFEKVTYQSGNMGVMTNMQGSLQDAYNVFLQLISNPQKYYYRQKANKVIMVLSDGRPNMRADGTVVWNIDLTPDVRKIKQLGFVEMYAVGITDGLDQNFMQNTLATDPSLYIYQPTFTDLTNLAKSIRGDPYEKDYETASVDPLECREGCDSNAFCGCNLKSGKYKCACKVGYYGTAEKQSSGSTCHRCPVDTYGDRAGMVTACKACPSNSGTNGTTGNTQVAQCTCKLGYTGNPSIGLSCDKVKCNPVNGINNGFIDNPTECGKNEYGAKCIFRCNGGFKLHGNDVLTCNHKGIFSGSTPTCLPLRCPAAIMQNTNSYEVLCRGNIDVASDSYGVGIKCNYTCRNKYFHLNGTKVRECLSSETWSGEEFSCKEIACPKIPKGHEKLLTGSAAVNCFERETKVEEICSFECPLGYQLSGSRSVTCSNNNGPVGKWTTGAGNFVAPNCTDIQRPKFANENECANGISLSNTTLLDRSYGVINFDAIGVTDNSGGPITIESTPPGYQLGRSYNIGITDIKKSLAIKFTATDASNNKAECKFFVEILDKQKPKLLKCPDENIIKKTSKTQERVIWTEPTYSDNCGNSSECQIDIYTPTPPNSIFQQGSTTPVSYKATDPSGNSNEKCIFNVIIKAPTCDPLPPPRNGMSVDYGSMSIIACPTGLFPNEVPPIFYQCMNEKWVGVYAPPRTVNQLIPDCISKTAPSGLNVYLFMSYQYNGDCSSAAAQEKIKTSLKALCRDQCTKEGMKAHCGPTSVVKRRARRSLQDLSIRIELKVTTSKEDAKKDPDGNEMKTRMQNDVLPNVIKEMKSTPPQTIDQSIQGFSRDPYSDNNLKLSCAGDGEVYNEEETSDKRCAGCIAGQFKNLATGTCQPCPKGTYQPNEGATSCISCPEGSTTVGNDVRNETSCRKLCKPGEFSDTGFAPCKTAPPGTYVEGSGKKSYVSCPAGTTTVTPGAKSRYDCGTSCQPGTYSVTGVESCSPCEQGTYQHEDGKVNCIDCPGLQWTYGEGADDLSKCVDVDSCSSSPCLNSGHCIDLKVGFRCECKAGFWGSRCEKEVDECALRPCLNGGKCLDKFQGYKCVCSAGSTGKNCETLIGTCRAGFCGQNGQCRDLADNSFKCVCNDGYTGQFCETFIDACQDQPCKNDGVCESTRTDFTCKCKTGFTGKQCETNMNFCSSEPCMNGGECSDSKYGFVCNCKEPYFGLRCEQKTNMCQHTTCKHSVTCKDLSTDVKCSCLPGYGGKLCDKKLGSDFDIGFQNREAPTFSAIEGKYDLSQLTVAFWMRTSDLNSKGTPLSYANTHNGKIDDNAFVLTDYSSFDLTINNVTANLGFSANDGEWHHIAVTWSSATGTWIAYKDGAELKRSTAAFQQGQVIGKGGLFVVGEEQDEIGGSFTPTESFFGDMSQLNVWKRVLSANEIYDLTMSCKHTAGDVLAWADFSEQSHGNIIKTEPSLACDFRNDLREYQVLKEWQLPSHLRSVISTESHSHPKLCAQRCTSSQMGYKCRSFIFDKSAKRCTFYTKSLLIHEGTAEKAAQYDLYQYSCVKPLGLSTKEIPDSRITASSSLSGSSPSMARLFNTPRTASQTFAHWSPNDNNPYIQIDLGSYHKVTGIATQGHYISTVREFATFYTIQYKLTPSAGWTTYNPPTGSKMNANTNSYGIVRNEVLFYAWLIRIIPGKDSSSSRIAMRMEIYGCPHRPQGQPVAKSDGNNCGSSTCNNGGQCIDLYQRYACVCPEGFSGSRCEQAVGCPSPDIPVYGRLISKTASAAQVECLPGYTTSDNARKSCVKGSWIGSQVTCKPKNNCASSPCFANNCQELVGGYRCYCPAGYVLASDGHTCQDINECSKNNGGCSHTCINTIGSFRCTCPARYRLSGKLLCIDDDECERGNHGCSQDCKNTLGSYQCQCKSGYSLLGDGKSCNQIACPYINDVANGHVSRSKLKVTYSCSAGYQLNGPSTRLCHPDGKWSGTQPTCTRVNCGTLRGETATVSVSSTFYNGVARFSCPASYKLIGTSTRTCLQSGEWSGTQPRCSKFKCPVLSNPLHGEILGLALIEGSVARVKCNKGYRLVQNNLELRTCQSNGQWTGGNTATMTCELIDCGMPPSKPYMQVTLRHGTKYSAIATYTCSQSGGQKCLEGPATRHCNADGKWSGTEPSCIANSCCKPKVPEHSTFYSDNRFNYGDKVYTSCDVGYVIGGTAFRVCQNNGQWSGTQTTCTITDCGDPGFVSNGVRTMSDTVYQSTANYFCNPGYLLIGSTKRQCQANGTWSGQSASCVKSSCGGLVAGSSGRITVGGGKNVCHWMIQVNQGKKVNINFATFGIGAKDKVKIFDGQKYEEYITFTKVNKPRSFTGNSHFMRVIYYSEDNTGTGFTLDYKEATCGGHLDTEYGVITSPGFPVSYKPNDECFWTVHRPHNNLQIAFTDFYLQKSYEDFVEIYEGPFANARMLLYPAYGYGRPLAQWADRWMWIHFKVNEVFQDVGFKGVYGIYRPPDYD